MSNDSDDIFCNHSIKNDFLPVLIAFSSTGVVCVYLHTCYCLDCHISYVQIINKQNNPLSAFGCFIFCLTTLIQMSALWQKYWKGENYQWCVAEGFFVEYSGWVMLLSTLVVTLHLTNMVLFAKYYKSMTKLEPFYLLFPWIFPAIIAWIPFVHNNCGVVHGPWCWIKLYNDDCSWNKEGMIEVYGTLYGELFLGLILNNIALTVVLVTLCKRSCYNNTSLDYRKALKQTLPLIGFPVMYQILSWIALANRIYQASISGKYMKLMFFGHAVS